MNKEIFNYHEDTISYDVGDECYYFDKEECTHSDTCKECGMQGQHKMSCDTQYTEKQKCCKGHPHWGHAWDCKTLP